MTVERRLGYRVDTPDARDRAFEPLFGAPTVAVPSLLDRRGKRLFQGRAGSCVAFSLTRAVFQSHWAALGREPACYASPAFLYGVGRLQEWAGLPPAVPRPRIADEGMRPRLAMSAVRNVGIAPESAYPYTDAFASGDPTTVNATPPPEAYEAAYDQRGLEYRRVLEIGSARVDAVAAALRAGQPVIFGMQVDMAFMGVRSMQPVDRVDLRQLVGGHMMSVQAVLDDGAGDVLVDNWWHDWGGDDGMAVLSRGLFGSALVTDVYVVKAAPWYTS